MSKNTDPSALITLGDLSTSSFTQDSDGYIVVSPGAASSVTGISFAGGTLTVTRSGGLPNLTTPIPVGAMPAQQTDGSWLFHNGVDADVSIPKSWIPDNTGIQQLLNALDANAYLSNVTDAFGAIQYKTLVINP